MKNSFGFRKLSIMTIFTLIGCFSNAQTISIETADVNYPRRTLLPISVFTYESRNFIEGIDMLEGTTWKFDYQKAIQQQFSNIGKHLFENANNQGDEKIGYFLFGVAYGLTESNGIRTIGSDVTTTVKLKWVFGQNQDTMLVIEDVVGSGTTNIGNAFSGKGNAKKRMQLAVSNAFSASYDTLYNNIGKLIEFTKTNPNILNSDFAFKVAVNRSKNIHHYDINLIKNQIIDDVALLKYNQQFPNSPFSQKIVSKLEENHAKDENYAELLNKLRVFKILPPQSSAFVVGRLLHYENLQKGYSKQKITTYQMGVTKESEFLDGGWDCVAPLSDTYGIVGYSNSDSLVKYEVGIIIFDKGFYAKNTNYSQFLKEFEDVYKEIKSKSKLIYSAKNLDDSGDSRYRKNIYKVDNKWTNSGKRGSEEIKEVTILGTGFKVDVSYSFTFKGGILTSIQKY